jgi:hypothetical protein
LRIEQVLAAAGKLRIDVTNVTEIVMRLGFVDITKYITTTGFAVAMWDSTQLARVTITIPVED